MKVYEAVANAFVKEGTTKVFGLLGDGQLPWWAAMAKYPSVQIVDARHEAAALTMAEGYARVTGKVGVCSVTHGPGVSHITSSLIGATRSHVPIIVYTSKTRYHNDDGSQFLDQDRLVSATGAGYIELMKTDFTETAVRQAFYRAKLESKPIVLCVPHDIQNKDCDSDGDEYQTSETLFRGRQKIRADLDQLQEAVELIAKSKKPVILLGRGATAPRAQTAAASIATRIGALITTTLLAKGTLQESEYHAGISGLFSFRPVMELFGHADCVIAVGAGLNERTLQGGYLYPSAKIIQIDIKPHVLMGNLQPADCYVQGDSITTLEAIDEMLAKRNMQQQGYRTAEVRKTLAHANRDPTEYEIELGTVDPREAARLIDDNLPADVAFVTGAGHIFSVTTLAMHKPRYPTVYIADTWGCIGQAVGAAIGAAVGLEGKPVLHMEGDGGVMQNIQELDTAGRLKLNILFVIMNDEALGAEYQKLKATGGDHTIASVRSPDFAKVAEGFGCHGRTARSLDDVNKAVNEFRSGVFPMVLDIRTSRKVVGIPYRRLHFGEDV